MTDPADPRRAVETGLRHLTHERIGDAIEALGDAIRLDPADPAAHAFMAAALFAAGRADEAGSAIERALDLDPDGFWPHLKAGELRFRLGDTAAAESHFLIALRSVEPGTRESRAAADALARARQAMATSIAHRAILPARLHRLLGRPVPPPGVGAGQARAGP
jgi:tetratricopeptide (TPR) repeat protein